MSAPEASESASAGAESSSGASGGSTGGSTPKPLRVTTIKGSAGSKVASSRRRRKKKPSGSSAPPAGTQADPEPRAERARRITQRDDNASETSSASVSMSNSGSASRETQGTKRRKRRKAFTKESNGRGTRRSVASFNNISNTQLNNSRHFTHNITPNSTNSGEDSGPSSAAAEPDPIGARRRYQQLLIAQAREDGKKTREEEDKDYAIALSLAPEEDMHRGMDYQNEYDRQIQELVGGNQFDPLTPRENVEYIFPEDVEYLELRGRMDDRLKTLGLAELKINPDGNCQFSSLSDQLYRTAKHHKQLRRVIVRHIMQNPDTYAKFVVGDSLRAYGKRMRRNAEWGDHVTLQAASNLFGVQINLITTYESQNILEIRPAVLRSKRVLFLSFFAEIHYNSVYPESEIETVKRERKEAEARDKAEEEARLDESWREAHPPPWYKLRCCYNPPPRPRTGPGSGAAGHSTTLTGNSSSRLNDSGSKAAGSKAAGSKASSHKSSSRKASIRPSGTKASKASKRSRKSSKASSKASKASKGSKGSRKSTRPREGQAVDDPTWLYADGEEESSSSSSSLPEDSHSGGAARTPRPTRVFTSGSQLRGSNAPPRHLSGSAPRPPPPGSSSGGSSSGGASRDGPSPAALRRRVPADSDGVQFSPKPPARTRPSASHSVSRSASLSASRSGSGSASKSASNAGGSSSVSMT